jgi:transposase-like protein
MSRKPTFTQEIDLLTLITEFGSEEKCIAYLEALRWPDGVACPRCESRKISRIKKRAQFDCDGCRYQFSVRVGTIFHDSHLPLWKWFLAVYVTGESKNGVSANQLKRMLGVSYKTAWYMSHRIRAAMVDELDLLTATVEADETWIGHGPRKHYQSRKPTTPLTTVMGAVDRGEGGRVRVRISDHRQVSKADVAAFLGSVVADDAAIYSDGAEGIADGHVNHATGQWVQADVHTNTIEGVWSLFKRSMVGSYHHLSVKHLPAYLDEMAFRYNNRENAYVFRDTLIALIGAESLPYADLIEGAA